MATPAQGLRGNPGTTRPASAKYPCWCAAPNPASAPSAYIEALGGKLEISAVFDEKRVRLKGV